jgi:hypothetical protein
VRISAQTVRTCAICERTLLMGERPVRFAPAGGELVDVCPLCQETALEHGWVREGSPSIPTMAPERRRRRLSLTAIFEPRRTDHPEPIADETSLRRLSRRDTALLQAAEIFNASPYRRSVAGIGKSLGEANASILELSGVNREVVITVAWDISWYQYRISFDSIQPVRVAERGYELEELESKFKAWNAHVSEDGRVVPDVQLPDK